MMAVPIDTEPAFHAAKPILLFEERFYLPNVFFPQYDVAPDGQSFVITTQDAEPQIHIVQNWFEELKARVPAGRTR